MRFYFVLVITMLISISCSTKKNLSISKNLESKNMNIEIKSDDKPPITEKKESRTKFIFKGGITFIIDDSFEETLSARTDYIIDTINGKVTLNIKTNIGSNTLEFSIIQNDLNDQLLKKTYFENDFSSKLVIPHDESLNNSGRVAFKMQKGTFTIAKVDSLDTYYHQLSGDFDITYHNKRLQETHNVKGHFRNIYNINNFKEIHD